MKVNNFFGIGLEAYSKEGNLFLGLKILDWWVINIGGEVIIVFLFF